MALEDLIGGRNESVAFAPVELLILGLLRPLEAEVPGLTVCSELPDGAKLPLVFIRREPGSYANDSFGNGGDSRFLERAVFKVNVFVNGLNADSSGSDLSDICRRRLEFAQQKQIVVPGAGHISYLRTSSPYHAASDWAASTGVVQYARLPKGWKRYESTYGFVMRPDLDNPRDPLASLAT